MPPRPCSSTSTTSRPTAPPSSPSLAGVSKATMSRLFRSLGFADFDEVRDHLRGLRVGGRAAPDRRRHQPGSPTLAHETESIRLAVESPVVRDVVELLATARRVLVVGWRNSHPVALHLRQQLAHARADVRLAPLPGQVARRGARRPRPPATSSSWSASAGDRPGSAPSSPRSRRTGAAVVLLADPTRAPARRGGDVLARVPGLEHPRLRQLRRRDERGQRARRRGALGARRPGQRRGSRRSPAPTPAWPRWSDGPVHRHQPAPGPEPRRPRARAGRAAARRRHLALLRAAARRDRARRPDRDGLAGLGGSSTTGCGSVRPARSQRGCSTRRGAPPPTWSAGAPTPS